MSVSRGCVESVSVSQGGVGCCRVCLLVGVVLRVCLLVKVVVVVAGCVC